MSLLSTISRFSTAAADGVPAGYTVKRRSDLYASNGTVLAGNLQTFMIDAVIQPIIGGDGMTVAHEGSYTSNLILIFSTFAFNTRGEPDHIVYQGEDYTINNYDGPFNINGVAFYRAVGARQAIP